MEHLGAKNQPGSHYPVSLRCPSCGQNGTFTGRDGVHDLTWQQQYKSFQLAILRHAGARICPNMSCRAVVFVVCQGNELIESYPRQLIDFDSTNLPSEILDSLREAVLCHGSGAYRASALMVRRVLEELCKERSAEGKDLFARLEALRQSVVLPEELLQAAHELRVLGNDAAHIEAKAYDEITETEASLALELAKELLKAVYQYKSLVDRMRALKKQ